MDVPGEVKNEEDLSEYIKTTRTYEWFTIERKFSEYWK